MFTVLILPEASGAVRNTLPLALAVGGAAGLLLMATAGIMAISRVSARATLRGLQAALDAAPNAMGFFDHAQRLTFWNRPFAELWTSLGLTPSVGLRFDAILAAATAAGVRYTVTPQS